MTCIGFINLAAAALLLFYQIYLRLLEQSKRRYALKTDRSKRKEPAGVGGVDGIRSISRPVIVPTRDAADEFTSLLAVSGTCTYGTSSYP